MKCRRKPILVSQLLPETFSVTYFFGFSSIIRINNVKIGSDTIRRSAIKVANDMSNRRLFRNIENSLLLTYSTSQYSNYDQYLIRKHSDNSNNSGITVIRWKWIVFVYGIDPRSSTGSSHHSRSERQPSSVDDNDQRDTIPVRITSAHYIGISTLMILLRPFSDD